MSQINIVKLGVQYFIRLKLYFLKSTKKTLEVFQDTPHLLFYPHLLFSRGLTDVVFKNDIYIYAIIIELMSYYCNLNTCRVILHTAPWVHTHYKDEFMLYVHELVILRIYNTSSYNSSVAYLTLFISGIYNTYDFICAPLLFHVRKVSCKDILIDLVSSLW